MSNESSDPSGRALERQLQHLAEGDVVRDAEKGALEALPGDFPTLRAAVVVLKVLAVVYLLAAIYGTYVAHAEAVTKATNTSIALHIGVESPSLLPFVLAFLKEAFVAFFVFVSGEVIKMLLEIHHFVVRLRRL